VAILKFSGLVIFVFFTANGGIEEGINLAHSPDDVENCVFPSRRFHAWEALFFSRDAFCHCLRIAITPAVWRATTAGFTIG